MSQETASPRREPDWEAIRRLYEGREMTVAEIAASYGVSVSAIQRRRRAEGWTKRLLHSGSRRTPVQAIAADRSRLIARLLKVVDRNIELLEMRMGSEEPGTAADRERETRAIGALTRTIEKLTELQSDRDAVRANSAKVSSGSNLDEEEAVRLRLEIAERILRLRKHNRT